MNSDTASSEILPFRIDVPQSDLDDLTARLARTRLPQAAPADDSRVTQASEELDSLTADMMNCAPIGKPDAIIAALFLAHFVGDVPWGHIDMCGPAQAESATGLQVPGCSG